MPPCRESGASLDYMGPTLICGYKHRIKVIRVQRLVHGSDIDKGNVNVGI